MTSTLADRLQRALGATPGLSQAGLAKACGVKPPSVSAWFNGDTKTLKSASLLRAASYLHVNALWLFEARGPMRFSGAGQDQVSEGGASYMSGTSSRNLGKAASPLIRGTPQDLSLAISTEPDTIYRIEELDMEALPGSFALLLSDDAMAPGFTNGGVGRFKTSISPIAGRPVLVVDGEGKTYVREYRPRTGTHWLAVASNPAYEPLDSRKDELRVLAVMIGYDWPL